MIKKVEKARLCCELFALMDSIYLDRGGVELLTAMYKLVNLKMDATWNVESYITTFDGLVSEITSRGHEVLELEKALFLLFGIPEVWAQARAQIFLGAGGQEKVIVTYIKAAIRQYGLSFSLTT